MPTVSPFMVYIWSMADAIKDTLGTFMVPLFMVPMFVGAILSVVYFVALTEETEFAIARTIFKYIRRTLYAGIVVGLLHMLMPTSKTIALMAVVPVIVNSSVVQKDVPDLYEAAKNAAIAQLKEYATEKKVEPAKK